MNFSTKVRTIAAATATAGAMVAGVLIAAPADAATYYCGGNDCTAWISGSAADPTIRTYPDSYAFYGHFELQMPNSKVLNSGTTTWAAGGAGNTFKNADGGSGSYCITAWVQTGTTGYTKVGGECITA